MSVLEMPIEIIGLITENLELDDIFNFSLACHALSFIIRDGGICRQALIQNARFSPECREAAASGDYARGLRRLVKRWDAVRKAQPFSLAILAVCNDFIYANGAVCYTVGHEHLRVLLLGQRVTTESVVDTRRLMNKAIPDSRGLDVSACRPVHYAHGIVSCLFSYRKNDQLKNWLVLWNAQTRKVLAHRLGSTRSIFVRNTRDHFYYGTRSHDHEDGTKRWVLRALDLHTRQWDCKRIVIGDLIGDELGANISFEIFNGYLYGLSSQAVLDPDENKWNSFYSAFRFRLGSHSNMEILPKSASWRRRPTDGAIDDRWSSLNLFEDQSSGKIYIYESRKEWLPANSQSQRTCYRKELDFTLALDDEAANHESSNWDSERYHEPPKPEDLHVGDNGSFGTTFTFNNSLIRSYDPSSRCFIDLVNDPSLSDPSVQRLRLRVRPQLPDTTKEADVSAAQLLPNIPVNTKIPSPAGDRGVHFWPPEADQNKADVLLRQLHYLMRPQGPIEDIEWAMDERYLIYSPKATQNHQLRAIVLVSFDSALQLQGLSRLCGCYTTGRCTSISSPSVICNMNLADAEKRSLLLAKSTCELGKSKQSCSSDPQTCAEPDKASKADAPSWAATRQAFYLAITDDDGVPRGFDLTQPSVRH